VTEEREANDRRTAFEAGLAGEYFALTGLRAGTTAESSARASMFLTTMTGTLLALGFLAGNTDAAVPVAYAAVPTIALLGLLNFLRLVELAVLDVRALQAIQRVRSYWRDLVPEGPTYFPAPTPGQAIDIVLDTGERRGAFRATLTIAVAVGTMDSLWVGAGAGFAVADSGVATGGAVAVGALVGLALIAAMFWHQTRRFVTVVGGEDVPPTLA
jgi:hypothetical protein